METRRKIYTHEKCLSHKRVMMWLATRVHYCHGNLSLKAAAITFKNSDHKQIGGIIFNSTVMHNPQ